MVLAKKGSSNHDCMHREVHNSLVSQSLTRSSDFFVYNFAVAAARVGKDRSEKLGT